MSEMRKYCGITRLPHSGIIQSNEKQPFIEDTEVGQLLGDKIQASLLYGADLGSPVSVTYDENVEDDSSSHYVDVLGSPNHDFFDIAEDFGSMVEPMAGPISLDNE